ncbi:MAG: hypothetical protein QE485_12800 [Acidovorax sp.]|uniref:hypothetical protein n=1 Tax=Acidovorax sp. TaxID=1872122 RepID=UPI00261DC5F5|nr:hypothetical protein [Acidovorax sp.]MDH4418095.1 hypothetical protein [Acidovorax sp.]
MKTYTIAPVSRVTPLAMWSTYVATFAVLWLFVEHLGAFGLIPSVSKLAGLYLYSLLLLVPAVALPFLLRWYRWYRIHHLPFVRISVRSTADGVTYSFRVAENMQISEFLHQYMDILLRGPARDKVAQTLRRYYPVLQAKRDGEFVDLDGNATLYAAGMKDGEECQVRAEEYKHTSEVRFSLT